MATTDKIHLDFQYFSTGDPKILVISDTSIWSFIEDKPAIIEIIPPGIKNPIVYNFIKNKNNVFNSSNLYLSPLGVYQDLSDGIYKVTVKGSPDTFCKQRNILKTDKTRLELYKLYLSLGLDGLEKNSELLKIIEESKLLIEAAEALVTLGKIHKGQDYLKRAVSTLKNYEECKDCK